MRKCILLVIFLSSLIFAGCKKDYEPKFYLDETFFWTKTTADSTPEDAERIRSFKKLNNMGYRNLEKLVGIDGSYLWLKSEFFIPAELRDCELGLVIPYIHMADEVYINGVFVGSHGNFPPDERAMQFTNRFYHLSKSCINQSEKNTLYIKVWAHGRSSIANGVYIGEYEPSRRESDKNTFLTSTIYMLFVGGCFMSWILFAILYITRKQEKEYMIFSNLSCTSLFLLSFFYGPITPWFYSIPYLLYTKVCLCISFYIISFLLGKLAVEIVDTVRSFPVIVTMQVILWVSIIYTLVIPDYALLIKSCPFLLAASLAQILIGYYYVIRNFRFLEYKKMCLIVLIGYLPMEITMFVDVVLRHVMQVIDYPYFVVFGWNLTLIMFMIMFGVRYSRIHKSYDLVVNDLEKQVEIKTSGLITANEELEKEITRSKKDLEMAAAVQKKFFMMPETNFRGWDVATSYEALSSVSGDLYEYFYKEEKLEGLALFDASGHGIAAGLITMLAKNIIQQSFEYAYRYNVPMSEALEEINYLVIEAKGNVDNYLTGLLLQFYDFDKKGNCRVSMTSGGHPYPIFYSDKRGDFVELHLGENQKQFGAIGISNIEVSFPSIEFEMEEDDILVCFTDGLIEAMSVNREEFGRERVMEIIRKHHEKDAQQILRNIMASLNQHVQGSAREDDVTVIVLKREKPDLNIEEI